MKYYPVNIDIRNKKCLVVGGGSVGARKALTLLKAGAATTIVSMEFSTEFKDIKAMGAILVEKEYEKDDLENIFLVIGATDNARLNRKISCHAEKKGILCNIADLPGKSDFILPSIIDRGDLMITISTSGKSPALAKKIRQDLDGQFGREYGQFLVLMGAIRKRLLLQNHAPDEHRIIFKQLIQSDLLQAIRNKDQIKADLILEKLLGKNYTYENLVPGDAR